MAKANPRLPRMFLIRQAANEAGVPNFMKRGLSPLLLYSWNDSPEGRFSVKLGNMKDTRLCFWGTAIESTRLLRREEIFESRTLPLSGSCRETEPIMHCSIIPEVVVSSSIFVSAFRTSILAASGTWLWLFAQAPTTESKS